MDAGLDLLAHHLSSDRELQEQRRSLDGFNDRASMSSSLMPQSPRMSTSLGQSFGLSRMLSIQPSHRRSEDSSSMFSRSMPFSRGWSMERSSSNAADSSQQVNLEDMEACVQGYSLFPTQSTPPMAVPTLGTKAKQAKQAAAVFATPPTSPIVGRSAAASLGDIDVYWKSMYLE